MAIGSMLRAGVSTIGQIIHTASIKGKWIVCHDNLEATAETAAVLLKPYSAVTTTLHWVKVPDGATRVMIRAKNDAAATTFTTSPAVVIMGAYGTPNDAGEFSGTVADAHYARFLRLDTADSNGAAVTLTLAATGNQEDASFEYSDVPTLDGYDLKGCDYVAMLVQTAANVTGGALNGVYGELMFLN